MGRGWLILTLLAAGATAASAQDFAINPKHDLSCFGPGPIRALDETEVCIFCHVPHNASPAAPLWNRYNPATYYRIYRSSTTDALIDQPGPASKQCLSCHDGSIALGLTLDRPFTDPIPMTHLYMPSGPSNLTNDLSDDHPIGFRYNRTLTNRDQQLRPPQLVDNRIKFGPHGEVECVACHDPHINELGNFLRITDRQGALCLTCHELQGWPISGHATSATAVPVSVTNGEQLPYRSMADNACASCHVAHSAPRRVRLLYDQPSKLCIECHNGLAGSNVASVIGQRYGHRINTIIDRDVPPGQRVGGIRQTVECGDCHNPHAVANGPAQPVFAPSNAPTPVPPEMRFVPGINIGGAPIEQATLYYEVCLKCHADAPAVVRDRIIRQRDNLGNVRTQFLPTAASYHPVAFPTRNNADEVPSLIASQRNRRFIGCQDCHNNPDADALGGIGGVPAGPHGSRYQYLLSAQYETRDFTVESPQSYSLCYQCHDRNSILNNESFPLHREHIVNGRSPCSSCHAAHGVSGSPANHDNLINFDLTIVGGERFYADTGRQAGTCTLTCHGVRHVNFAYGTGP